MRKVVLALALIGFGAGSAVACPFAKGDVAESPKPIITADGKIVTPAAPTQTPMPTPTDG